VILVIRDKAVGGRVARSAKPSARRSKVMDGNMLQGVHKLRFIPSIEGGVHRNQGKERK
jgi:hypothetical protein